MSQVVVATNLQEKQKLEFGLKPKDSLTLKSMKKMMLDTSLSTLKDRVEGLSQQRKFPKETELVINVKVRGQ